MRENHVKRSIVFWIFKILDGNASNALEWEENMVSRFFVNIFWYDDYSRKCNKLSNLFNCLVLSHENW